MTSLHENTFTPFTHDVNYKFKLGHESSDNPQYSPSGNFCYDHWSEESPTRSDSASYTSLMRSLSVSGHFLY